MEIAALTLGLAFLAGLVTTLSPCVLPILPMIASAATGRHPLGLPALAAGLALAFTLVGVTVAASGHLLGLEEATVRLGVGALMTLVAVVLLNSRLQQGFARAAAGLGGAAHGMASGIRADHPGAQFALGTLMGVAWSPCVGPTLGAAIALAAGGGGVPEATVIMAVFSVAAVIPLTAVGMASRRMFALNRAGLQRVGEIGRLVMGWSLLLIGGLVLLGLDKRLEAWLLDLAPEWLLGLTTRF